MSEVVECEVIDDDNEQDLTFKVSNDFKPLYEKVQGKNDYIYFVYYGGRGGGKTESVAQFLISLVIMIDFKIKIICIREFQNSINESVKSVLEDWIGKFKAEHDFLITRDRIYYKPNGSYFIFKGMQDYNIASIKSLNKFDIVWVEEAETIKRRSLDVLLPTVLRGKNRRFNFIIFTFNPRYKTDPVYSDFIESSTDDLAYVKKINYTDNPFYANSNLELERTRYLNTKSIDDYRHVWLGELINESEGTLFPNSILEKLHTDKAFSRDDFYKIVIGCDPATTNKDYSNEYGISVYGIAKDGLIYGIDDLSGNMTPYDFSIKVSEAYREYKADAVIIEVNNGGDFIKATLLNTNPSLNVIEVRANKDKIKRAMPLANLIGQGKIKHFSKKMIEIEKQMGLMTNYGYKGMQGESPDRLDSAVWAVYNLANIEDTEQAEQIFKPSMFNNSFKGMYLENQNIAFVLFLSGNVCLLKYDYYKYDSDITLNFKDCFVCNSYDLNNIEIREFFSNVSLCNVVENSLSELFIEKLRDGVGSSEFYYNGIEIKKNLHNKNLALNILPLLNKGIVNFDSDFMMRSFKSDYGNLLQLNLLRYNIENKADDDNIIVRAFLLCLYDFFKVDFGV